MRLFVDFLDGSDGEQTGEFVGDECTLIWCRGMVGLEDAWDFCVEVDSVADGGEQW